MIVETVEPIRYEDLKKDIIIPRSDFETWMEKLDWTFHQIARGEFPSFMFSNYYSQKFLLEKPFESLELFQLACICNDPALWVPAFLREPEDPDHNDPYGLWTYQMESIRYTGHTIHYCGSEVGKTREIIAYSLWKSHTVNNGSGLIGAPQQTHLDEIIEGIYDQLEYNEDLMPSLVKWKKHPHHQFKFVNKFRIDFRPSGHDGEAYRSVHVRTFAIKDEAAKDKHKKQWSEFWRAMKPTCTAKIYSVPDGDRSCDFYKLGQRARSTKKEEEVQIDSLKDASGFLGNIKFKRFDWPKTIMPYPYWSEERRKFYIDQYGGEDSAEYKHNVHGQDGDPEYSVFPWQQLTLCVKDIPEYRCLKVLVDSTNNEVSVSGYKCELYPGDTGPVPRSVSLMDTIFSKKGFFEYRESTESQFRLLIKSFFSPVPGLCRGGADFGFTGDPTEIIIKNIIGKRERMVARLQLKHVTYDQQTEALDALDDVFGPDIIWGTDFGNAGSAVAHNLQGLPRYEEKDFEERLKGFMFESMTENVNEDGEPILDKEGNPVKITMKELATDLMVSKIQRVEVEYPPDPDIAFYYPNHTVSNSGKHRIFKKKDDHLIDAERCEQLAKIQLTEREDLFACGN